MTSEDLSGDSILQSDPDANCIMRLLDGVTRFKVNMQSIHILHAFHYSFVCPLLYPLKVNMHMQYTANKRYSQFVNIKYFNMQRFKEPVCLGVLTLLRFSAVLLIHDALQACSENIREHVCLKT